MKVNPISSTNFSNLNNVNFSGRKKDNSQNNVTDVIRSKAATVPVVVLLAANPATLNSAIPAQPIEGNRIEISQAQNDPEIDAKTVDFQEVQQTPQSNAPYGWPALYCYNILKKVPVKTDNGSGVLLFAHDEKDKRNSSDVNMVYMILNNEKPDEESFYEDPPFVTYLLYNKNPDKKGRHFSVEIARLKLMPTGGKLLKLDEIPIDNAAGLAIYNLYSGKDKFNDATSMKAGTITGPHKPIHTSHYISRKELEK